MEITYLMLHNTITRTHSCSISDELLQCIEISCNRNNCLDFHYQKPNSNRDIYKGPYPFIDPPANPRARCF